MPYHLFNTFFECTELISTEMNWHPSTFTLSPPPIQLPFPPPITAQDIVLKRPSSKICSKSPNAFFIYRKVYFDQLALLNQRFKMTDVSKLVSLYWNNECREVKEAYKKIAREVECELNERRKRDLVYPDINSNLKIARRRNKNNNNQNSNVSKKKCGKVTTTTTHNQNESANFEKGVVNQQSGAHFELTFSSDMQPLIHSYNADFGNVLMSNCTLNDTVSYEPTIFTVVTESDNNNNIINSETILDQNGVNDFEQNDYDLLFDDDDDDDVLDPIPAQSVNNQHSVENNDYIDNNDNNDNNGNIDNNDNDVNNVNPDLPNTQNIAFDEFYLDDNTNLNWYLQNFV